MLNKEVVIKWLMRQYDFHKVFLGYDILEAVMIKYGISRKEAQECKEASFRRYLGTGRMRRFQ
jgi:hypothetical protein